MTLSCFTSFTERLFPLSSIWCAVLTNFRATAIRTLSFLKRRLKLAISSSQPHLPFHHSFISVQPSHIRLWETSYFLGLPSPRLQYPRICSSLAYPLFGNNTNVGQSHRTSAIASLEKGSPLTRGVATYSHLSLCKPLIQ